MNGIRPPTRYGYGIVTAVTGLPVTVLTGTSTCRATAAVTGQSSPCAGGAADEVRTIIAYDSVNIRPTSVTVQDGAGTLVATTTMTDDAIGNLLTVDGPLPGTADTTRYRYDAGRAPGGQNRLDPPPVLGKNRRTTKLSEMGELGKIRAPS